MTDSETPADTAAPRTPAAPPPRSDDEFIRRFRAKLPDDVAESFDDKQLEAIATVFGARRWREHAIDLRLLIPFFGRSLYFVALAGGERRTGSRRLRDRLLHPIATAGNAALASVFFTGILFSLLAVLYVLKSALGIDLLPGTSLGLMSAIKEEFEMLFR